MTSWIVAHIWFIPAVPMIVSLVVLSLSRSWRKSGAALAIAGQIIALLLAVAAFLPTLQQSGFRAVHNFTWFRFGDRPKR